jgi:DHA1 family tetracycline resistance protein-like MFS transporter
MGLFGPSAQGIMSQHVAPAEQGQLQGAQSSIMGITGMIGPGLFTWVFASSIDARKNWNVPGAPFFVGSSLLLAALLLAAWVTRRRSQVRVPTMEESSVGAV